MALYEDGDLVRCSSTFANDFNVPTDPTTLTFEMVLGVTVIATALFTISVDGGTISPTSSSGIAVTMSRDTDPVTGATIPKGAFAVDWNADPGSHVYAFKATGRVQRTVVSSFTVRQSVP